MWKDRIWNLFLVIVSATTLSVCSSAMDDSGGSSGGIAMASFKPGEISAVMVCSDYANVVNLQPSDMIYKSCDASDGTVLETILVSYGPDRKVAITHDDAIAQGWKLVGTYGT